MAKFNYNISEIPVNFTDQQVSISQQDSTLIDKFDINTLFDQTKNRIDLLVYTLDNQLLEIKTGYTGFTQLLNSAGAGKAGTSNITINPENDLKVLGYENGDVRFLYTFNIYTFVILYFLKIIFSLNGVI